MNLEDPIHALLVVHRALARAGIRAAMYGGLALAAYGEPRETRDADLAVAGTSTGEALEALEGAGVTVSLSFDRERFGGLLISRIALLAAPGADGLNVADLVEPRSTRYAALALSRAVEGRLRSETVTVLTPEDFVLFKVLSTREIDVSDAASVVRALGSALDVRAIEEEAARVAAEIPDHDIRGRLERVIEGARRAPR